MAKTAAVPKAWPHQEATKRFGQKTNRILDTSDPGVGKTRAHVELFAERNTGKRCLVVCPKTLMRSAWGNDIARFVPKLTVAFADADTRTEAFQSGARVVVINTDGVKWVEENLKALKILKDFDTLIVDEISYFKHPTSQRSKAIKRLAKLFVYRAGLTGTPNPISVTELWHPLCILDDGKRLGTSFFQFRNATQISEQVGPKANHLAWMDKPDAEVAVRELIADITIRHAFEDVMKHVPPNHTSMYEFELSKKAMALYLQLQSNAILVLEKSETTAVHAASLRSKLLQLASGAVYTTPDDDGKSQYEVVCRKRYELLADLVEERKHSVVFFNWRHQKEELAREFKARKLTFAVIDGSVKQADRDLAVKRFQNGELQTILLHPQTGAHGLTLTRGDTTFWTSPIYQADFLKQGKHRIYRGEQDKITNTVCVKASNTVEGDVYERLNARTGRMEGLLELLKRK